MLIDIKPNAPSRTDVKLRIADIVEAEYAAERADAAQRDATARFVAQTMHTDKTTVLGKCIGVIPLVDDLRLHEKYGRHVFSKEFWRYYQKHNREACPASV